MATATINPTWKNTLLTDKSFKEEVHAETLVSTGRATLEMTVTAASLAVLAAKGTAALWHMTTVGDSARNSRLVDTLRFEGETANTLTNISQKGIDSTWSIFDEDIAPKKSTADTKS